MLDKARFAPLVNVEPRVFTFVREGRLTYLRHATQWAAGAGPGIWDGGGMGQIDCAAPGIDRSTHSSAGTPAAKSNTPKP